MSKRKWYTKAIYLGVALAMTVGLLMVPATVGALDGLTVDFSPAGDATDPVRGELTVTADYDGAGEPAMLTITVPVPTLYMGNPNVLGQEPSTLTTPVLVAAFAAKADPTADWDDDDWELAREIGFVSAAYDSVAMKWTIVIDTQKKVQVCDEILIALGWMPGQEVWFDGVYSASFSVTVNGTPREPVTASNIIFDNPEEITPELSLNAKGAQQKFWLNWIDRVWREIGPEVWESIAVEQACGEGGYGGWLWTFDPGVMLETWGDPASPYDVKVIAGGRPYQDSAGDWHPLGTTGYPDRFIEIQARAPELGDFEVAVRLCSPYNFEPGGPTEICDEVASAEKKWGELAFSKLDVHIEDAVPGDSWNDVKAAVEADFGLGLDDDFAEWTGTDHEIDVQADTKEKIAEWVWADFLQLAEPEPAGGAVVHWWLAKDTVANQEWIQDLMDDIVARAALEDQGGRGHDLDSSDSNDYWSATGAYDPAEYPVDVIMDWIDGTSDGVEKFAVKTDLTGFEPDCDCDPYLCKDPAPEHIGPIPFINTPRWYGRSLTMDYHLNEIPGVTIADLSNTGAEDVLIITFVEYQQDYNGENLVLIEIGKKHFKELPPPIQVKTPQIRWAGEKLVLEKDWGKHPYFECGCIYEDEGTEELSYGPCGELPAGTVLVGDYVDARIYIAIYNLELGSVGNLEPINELEYISIEGPDGMLFVNIASIGLPMGAQQVIAPLGGGYYEVDGEGPGLWMNSVSQAIVCTEQSGEADVNAGLYEVGMHFASIEADQQPGPYMLEEMWLEGPIDNHGFLAYFLDFEDVVLAENLPREGQAPDGDFDVTTEDSFQELTPLVEPAEIAVQVRGFFDYRWSHLLATWRTVKELDINGDGFTDYYLPAGRYVLPDDWWLLAGTDDVSLRPNWDLMDQANLDDIDSAWELGPYDTDVWTTDPPAEAEYPCIGPFNTLQQWSAVDKWIATATVPSSLPPDYLRNTVVPDGEDLNWFDCPMPQALVMFDIVDSDVAASLSGLDKGDVAGYGYVGTPKVYQSPFYEVEIPASPYIPGGYNWESWTAYGYWGWATIDGPYDYWTDLQLESYIADTSEAPVDTQDVEVYCDNHGIAGMQIDPLSEGGYVTITATAEFPYTPKRGKYGPRVSDEITATWGPLDLNPHFTVSDATPDVGQLVTFDPTTTAGGKLPYIVARWDWEGDLVWDITLDITVADNPATPWDDSDPMAVVSHAYLTDGLYWPCLEVTESSTPSVIRYECRGEDDPIIVGEGLTEIEWSCPLGGELLIAPNPGQERPFLMVDADPTGITVAPVAEELWGIYWLDEGTGDWLYYIPGFVSTLLTLENDQYYYVVVSDTCTLTIPQ